MTLYYCIVTMNNYTSNYKRLVVFATNATEACEKATAYAKEHCKGCDVVDVTASKPIVVA